MIVQPNFLDHWKTRALGKTLGDDPLAPCYILRLWGHCQNQKTHRFREMNPRVLAGICCFSGDPATLLNAITSCGFAQISGGYFEVHEWAEYNSGLISSWKNGRKGGRPKKPTGIPRVTHGVTDREDKIREDKIESIAPTPRARNEHFDALAEATEGVPPGGHATNGGKIAAALKAIRKALPDVTPEEIRRRASEYPLSMPPGSIISATALAAHWHRCDGSHRPLPSNGKAPRNSEFSNAW